jgi:hypothetical protein
MRYWRRDPLPVVWNAVKGTTCRGREEIGRRVVPKVLAKNPHDVEAEERKGIRTDLCFICLEGV